MSEGVDFGEILTDSGLFIDARIFLKQTFLTLNTIFLMNFAKVFHALNDR